MNKKKRIAWLSLIGGVLAVIAGYLAWYWYHPLHPGEQTFELKPGMSLRSFAQDLAAHGVIPEPRSFVWLAMVGGRARSLKAGEYRFPDGISASALLEQVISGKVIEYPFALIEGWSFRQVTEALDRAPRLDRTLRGLAPAQIMARLGHADEHWEGRFLPDTYRYSAGTTDLTILSRAYEAMRTRLDREWAERDTSVALKAPHDVLILASIVEKETGKPEERPLIAGVFLNRLNRGMKLQTDPTVIYGLGDKFDGNLRLRDLRADTPYNTYTRPGLPPTPIAMPGAAAIRAVLHPSATRALYFVSRGDGSHVFTETLKDHNEAVIKYQLKGRTRPFSSNPPTP